MQLHYTACAAAHISLINRVRSCRRRHPFWPRVSSSSPARSTRLFRCVTMSCGSLSRTTVSDGGDVHGSQRLQLMRKKHSFVLYWLARRRVVVRCEQVALRKKKLKTCLFESAYWERIKWHWSSILRYTNAHIDWLIDWLILRAVWLRCSVLHLMHRW